MQNELTLPYRLGRLVEYMPDANGDRQSHNAIAAAASEILHREVRSSYVDALMSGEVRDADPAVLAAIAQHFTAPESYLIGTPQEQLDFDQQLDFYSTMRDSGATVLALRTRQDQVDPVAAKELAALIQSTRARYRARTAST